MPSRPQHERIWQIVRLISKGDFPNCTDFAGELETSRRSVMRDLDYLRDRLGMPIEFDAKRRGYFLTRPVADIPVLEVTVADLVALTISEQMLAAQVSPETAARLRGGFDRVRALLGAPITLSGLELSALLSVKQQGTATVDYERLNGISQALAERREIRFRYDGGGRDLSVRRLQGVNLTVSGGQWYLLGHDFDREGLRIFAFSRIKRLRLGKSLPKTAIQIDARVLMAESFGIAHEGRPVEQVVVWFSARAAGRVVGRHWHSTQKITQLRDGSCRLTMEVSPTEELRSWLLSWGREANLEAPEWLRKEVAQELRAAGKNYR